MTVGSFSIDTRGLEEALFRVPIEAHYWLQAFFRNSLFQHRIPWLKTKSNRFGRGASKAGRRAIKVHRINEGPKVGGELDVVYHVNPPDRKFSTPIAASNAIDRLIMETYVSSPALETQEFGIDVHAKAGKWMAVPIKTRPGHIGEWKKKYPERKLIVVKKKNRTDQMLLLQVPKKRRKNSAKPKLRFALIKVARMNPTLQFYSTWDAGGTARDTDFHIVADKILAAMAKRYAVAAIAGRKVTA